MRNLAAAVLAAALAPFGWVASCRAQDVTTDSATLWQTDLPAARELAAQQHKPLLLLFRCER